MHRLVRIFAVRICSKVLFLSLPHHKECGIVPTCRNKSAASTASCPVTALTSSKCDNAVKNKMSSTCYLVLLYIFARLQDITKTRLFKYIENFTSKNWKFSGKKKTDIFHISAQNIDCRYSLEPPRRGGFNEYPQSIVFKQNKKNNVYPCKPQFYYIKVGFKGVTII